MKTEGLRENICALVQPRPAIFREPPTIDEFEATPDAPRDNVFRHDDYSDHADEPRITAIDRAIIHNHFRENDSAPRKPSAAGGKWARGRRLSIRADVRVLDAALERKLNALPQGYVRVLAGSDLLLVRTATHSIIDVMRNIYATTDGHEMNRAQMKSDSGFSVEFRGVL